MAIDPTLPELHHALAFVFVQSNDITKASRVMKYFVYVLYISAHDRFHMGQTQDCELSECKLILLIKRFLKPFVIAIDLKMMIEAA